MTRRSKYHIYQSLFPLCSDLSTTISNHVLSYSSKHSSPGCEINELPSLKGHSYALNVWNPVICLGEGWNICDWRRLCGSPPFPIKDNQVIRKWEYVPIITRLPVVSQEVRLPVNYLPLSHWGKKTCVFLLSQVGGHVLFLASPSLAFANLIISTLEWIRICFYFSLISSSFKVKLNNKEWGR